jgi:WD40 repeat protein
VAFHPSGLHLVVAMQDKIEIYNVLSDKLTKSKTINQKGCGEIKFSNGGQYFATIKDQFQIWVYNFYTQECSDRMKFTGHVQKVKCIDWFENDLGFTTCDLSGSIYFYALNQYGSNIAIGQRVSEYNKKDCKFTSVANVPGKQFEVLAAGSDHMITSNYEKKGKVNPSVNVPLLVS